MMHSEMITFKPTENRGERGQESLASLMTVAITEIKAYCQALL